MRKASVLTDNQKAMTSKKKPALTKQRQRKKTTLRDRWPLTWAGSLLSSVLVAAATTAATVMVTKGTNAITDTSASRPTGGPPVTISSQVQQFRPYFAFPGPIHLSSGQLAELNENGAATDDDTGWFLQHGGAELDQSSVQLVLTGNAPGNVRVDGLTVASHCTPPLTGTIFANPGGGNQQQAVDMDVNLNAPSVIARTASGAPYFQDNSIELADGEEQPVELTVTDTKSYCSYTVEVEVRNGTRIVWETVPGGPFLVTGFASHYGLVYLGEPDADGSYQFTGEKPSAWNPVTMESG
jgi:hypothetical protein